MQPMATKQPRTQPEKQPPKPPEKQPEKRRYRSSLRARQAADTRSQVLVAAAALFEEKGWAGTTVAAIAERAGVAIETVYSGFGSKKHVLRAVLDFAVVGDAEPVPLVERDVFAALGEGDRDQRIRAGLDLLV